MHRMLRGKNMSVENVIAYRATGAAVTETRYRDVDWRFSEAPMIPLLAAPSHN